MLKIKTKFSVFNSFEVFNWTNHCIVRVEEKLLKNWLQYLSGIFANVTVQTYAIYGALLSCINTDKVT